VANGVASPTDLDGWLAELGVTPLERSEREGVVSWDMLLDGRRRRGIRVTLILDPHVALVGWVHYAPPLADTFRKSYRQFLRWNDELPFVKFALSEDERPVLSAEVPAKDVDRDTAGLMLARLVGVCDLLLDESVRWLWPGAKAPPAVDGSGANAALLDRYAVELAELSAPAVEADPGEGDAAPDRASAAAPDRASAPC
jgi:hypothetical protein